MEFKNPHGITWDKMGQWTVPDYMHANSAQVSFRKSDYDMTVTFTPKPKPLKAEDRVKHLGAPSSEKRTGVILMIDGGQAWVGWSDGGPTKWHSTESVDRLVRADG